jgi:hypothetical protein
MALTRLRIALGAVGGFIAAMTLQGCGDVADNMIKKACEMKSGEAIDELKKDIAEAAAEKCNDMLGNDTKIGGKSCETEINGNFSSKEAAEKAKLTEECIDWVNAKYANMTSGPNIFDNLAEMKESATEFFESAKDDMSDFKEGIVNGTSDLKQGIVDGKNDLIDGATDKLDGAKTTRLYIVADADQSVGAPRLAIGGSLAMIATGILAVAVAARFCSRRRGFHVVDGGEQAADGSAQHA